MARTARPTPQRFRDGWRIRWLQANGKRGSEVYASRKDAQFKLDAHLLEVEQVRRGLKGLAVPDKTFAQLCDHWMATRATRKRSAKDDESIIDSRLRRFFATRKLFADDIGMGQTLSTALPVIHLLTHRSYSSPNVGQSERAERPPQREPKTPVLRAPTGWWQASVPRLEL